MKVNSLDYASCLSGSMQSLELQVGEIATSSLAGKPSTVICLSAAYSFVVSGGEPEFFSVGPESVEVQPLVNEDAGEFSITVLCSIGPYSNEEIATFTVIVHELPPPEEPEVETSEEEEEREPVYVEGHEFPAYKMAEGENEPPLTAELSAVSQIGRVSLEFNK